MQLSDAFENTRTGTSFGGNFLCVLSGTVLQALFFLWAVRRKRGDMLPPSGGEGGKGGKGCGSAAAHEAEANPGTGGEGNTVAVSIRGLRKAFGDVNAVDGLSVDFYTNQITSFLGHNGAGESAFER